MAKERKAERSPGLAEPPSEVRISVVRDPDTRTPWERVAQIRISRRARMIAVFLLVVAATGGVVAAVPGGQRHPGARGTALPSERGPLGVAAAYGYPLRCLTITIAGSDPTYARADFDRTTPCGRYDGYATAIFHRVERRWRPVLNALSYTCPVASLPGPVQAELGVCPLSQMAGAAGAHPRNTPYRDRRARSWLLALTLVG